MKARVMDAATIAAFGTLILGVLGIVTKVLFDERANVKTLAEKHMECMENHAEQCEVLGGLRESVRILSMYQPKQAQEQVQEAMAVVDARIESKKNGQAH